MRTTQKCGISNVPHLFLYDKNIHGPTYPSSFLAKFDQLASGLIEVKLSSNHSRAATIKIDHSSRGQVHIIYSPLGASEVHSEMLVA